MNATNLTEEAGLEEADDRAADSGRSGQPDCDPATDQLNERIRERAYQLWQLAGSPDNRADDFWLEAEMQVRAGAVR
jgi:hypothetical protein